VDGTSSESCLVVGFGISGIESSGSATIVLGEICSTPL
jgi:hypothetical protein